MCLLIMYENLWKSLIFYNIAKLYLNFHAKNQHQNLIFKVQKVKYLKKNKTF